MISIITPIYNCELYLDKTIESVVNQSYTDWELILVDDCSQDGSFGIAQEWTKRDERIKVFSTILNSGPAAARNLGLEHANGDYIAFLDADDIWLQNKLSIQLRHMEGNNSSFTCTSYMSVGDVNTPIYKLTPPRATTYNKALLYGNPIGNSTVMITRKALKDIRIPDIKKRNDFALWLKVLKKGITCDGMSEVTMIYRRRKDSVSSKKIGLISYHWALYRHIEKLSIIKSCFYVFAWMVSKAFHFRRKKIKTNLKLL